MQKNSCTLRSDRLEHASRLLPIHRRINAHWLACWHRHAIQHVASMRRRSNRGIHRPVGTGGWRRHVTRHSHATYHCVAQSISWVAIATNTCSSTTTLLHPQRSLFCKSSNQIKSISSIKFVSTWAHFSSLTSMYKPSLLMGEVRLASI